MIPFKIETLLEGQVVEKNRVEYKEGWNPSDIIHTICAFANDLDNVNGGYVVVVEYPDPDTHLIYLKCTAGDAGPYQAPIRNYTRILLN